MFFFCSFDGSMENNEQELRRKCEFQKKTNVHILKLRNGTLIEYTCAPLQRAQCSPAGRSAACPVPVLCYGNGKSVRLADTLLQVDSFAGAGTGTGAGRSRSGPLPSEAPQPPERSQPRRAR